MKRALRRFLDALFPPRCGLCAKPAALDSEGVCGRCRAALSGLSAKSVRLNRSLLGECRIDEAAAIYAYREPVKGAIHRLKFYGSKRAGLCLGACMARAVDPGILAGVDFVTAVPVTKRRRKTLGYNHAEVLAGQFCRLLDLPCRFDVLVKVVDNTSQSQLDAGKRPANVRGAYAVAQGAELSGKCVLLIDDVLTTGSTLNECAAALKEAGARRVVCLTVAHPDFLQ